MTGKDSLLHARVVVRFEHERCGDYDGTEYLFAPEHWTPEQIEGAASEVRKEMVADAERVKASPLKPSHNPPYAEHPDSTVAEVQRLHEEQKAAYKAWQDENKRLSRSFADRMVERGFESLYEDSYEVEIYWGHHHGLGLNYGPPKRSDW